jgi:hypothetical protein
MGCQMKDGSSRNRNHPIGKWPSMVDGDVHEASHTGSGLISIKLMRLAMNRNKREEQILRASKEITVKFIEVGRLSPSAFAETFKTIYRAIDDTLTDVVEDDAAA